MTCPGCGTENREGRKFCSECGTALASACSSCGAHNEPGEKFCGECGTVLGATVAPSPAAPAAAPAAERRLVSVLFADLVGFTSASENRDAEETRELGDTEKLAELIAAVDALPTGTGSHFLRAHCARFRAHLADRNGDAENAHRLFRGAAGLYREIGTPFYVAVVQLEHVEWLAAQARTDEAGPLQAEAREIFERLEAAPWLERSEKVGGGARVTV